MQVDIEYLWSVVLVFSGYLAMFQSEEPLILCTCDALKTVVLTIFGHFLRPDLLRGISMNYMCMIDLEKEDNYLPQESIDISIKAKQGISRNEVKFFFHPLKSHTILQTLTKMGANSRSFHFCVR